MKPSLNEFDVITSSKENIVSDMGGEKVMLSVQTGNYYNLGQVGGQIWDAIAEPIAIGDLIERLITEFDVERAQCAEHVFAFLDHLMKEGLILVHSQNESMAGA
ncbi:lasso peptide biosynthesis PqqD family chaperone [Paenibacillus soyae]|uniref:Lasso peptide biosynthesis PqqD family chaperone n=1 Tax=Paenibacillus soyae TaxID=2969249 RepID=A0A9X2MLP4_9BACL|nr:lasso peptide biosynthesis PqqD family chaperone [Paenibacillus soyae]MCR2802525.1 lasso peptide biosynthesis PqqD family chaperone [Paenibacillus soyae]